MTSPQPDRILVIDDESDIAQILKLHLDEAGYLTSWAKDGESGLNQLRTNGFALALLDVRMPGISGVEVLQRLSGEKLNTAVIMMTAHGNENLVTECMKAGAADYVAKPFDIDDLLNRIERALANRRILMEKQLLEQEKGDFLFMLSHDLKNPITAVIGSIDIMREGRLGPVNPEQSEYLQSAIESCEEVVTMIDNLLDMRRFESGKMPTRLTRVDPHSLLENTRRHFSPAAERENITLTLTEPSCSTGIDVDISVMRRVIANLLGNALKFTPEGGSISLSCRCVDEAGLKIPPHVTVPDILREASSLVQISVSDSGIGISSDELSIIFDRFVQASNSPQRSRGGAGLGLAFCRKAVESFNGCIWAESLEGKGSRFSILLPGQSGDTTVQETHP